MSDRTITVTLKAGVGYDAPWVVIGGDQLDEVNFKLDSILAAGTLQKAAAVALAFQNGYRSLRHTEGSSQEPPQETYSQPPVGAQPTGGYQGPLASQTAPQGNPWANQPPPAQDPWANQGPPPQWATGAPQGQQQQQQPQSQAQGGRPPICQCGQAMEYKTTNTGRPVWRCRDWRWNNGNATPNHDQIWVEGNH